MEPQRVRGNQSLIAAVERAVMTPVALCELAAKPSHDDPARTTA